MLLKILKVTFLKKLKFKKKLNEARWGKYENLSYPPRPAPSCFIF